MNNRIGGDFITFKYRYRKQILIVSSIVILILGIICIFIFNHFKEDSEEEPIILENPTKKEEKKAVKKEKVPKEVKVDIKGEINNPGIYSLDNNSRVIDVIEKAGGLTVNADTSVLNLSKKISDEMVIIIYTKAEVKNFKETKEREKQVQEKCNQKDENALKNDACITNDNSKEQSGKVSINKATLEELKTLSGIGESKAKEIISYREKNGPFKSIDEITNVTGIGENIFAQIKENITL